MTETNPFGGGFDMNALLEQAQAMQQQMVSAQERLAEAEIEGTVADGLVTVTVDGTGEMRGVKIRANSFDPGDTEDLEDLIIAAYRDARSKADAAAAEAFGPLAGGLGGLTGGDGAGLPGLGALGGDAVPGETDRGPEGSGGSRSLGF
ncbi:YbaB/EbfC family nucleoid-associated protein [Nocardioides sp. HDW12B]|uniref:YbaB/EbfC family nucleoid-associated protein n=1 Tax=Nocardioides sp. HDW12B TaxID=2714939 RepID=UPI00140CDCBE|nr:YbaB/EbfC family nucleoid-associated protein [Nocardioides sp. HDW12B]QIK67667.1 YbaB/EbfC family nucleoid-associated protein [Nocardioides sp. HDW12B]